VVVVVFFVVVVFAIGLGRSLVGGDGEALAEVGVAEEAVEVLGGELGVVGGELAGGLGGGVGEVEVGLEAEGFLEGAEGGEEGGLAEPLAEDGWGGPVGGWRAGGVGAEGA
jgi:hypothetical protein